MEEGECRPNFAKRLAAFNVWAGKIGATLGLDTAMVEEL